VGFVVEGKLAHAYLARANPSRIDFSMLRGVRSGINQCASARKLRIQTLYRMIVYSIVFYNAQDDVRSCLGSNPLCQSLMEILALLSQD
jgi:hypothetical protein